MARSGRRRGVGWGRAGARRYRRPSAAGRCPHPAFARVSPRPRRHRAPWALAGRRAQARAPSRGNRGGGHRAAARGRCPGARATDTPQPGTEPGGRRPAKLPGRFCSTGAATCTHVSRAAAARRFRRYRPHRRLPEHDRRNRLTGHRQRGTPAVLRVHRWRDHVAAGPGPRAGRGPAAGGLSGRPGGRRSRRVAGGWPAGHLDQPQWRVLDAFAHPWHHPGAARRPDVGAEQHIRWLPGGRRGQRRQRRGTGGDLDFPRRPDLATEDGRATGPDPPRPGSAKHLLHHLARRGHGNVRHGH